MSNIVMERAIGIVVSGDWPRSVADVTTQEGPGWASAALLEARRAALRRLGGRELATAHVGIDGLRDPDVLAAVSRLGIDRFRAVLIALHDGDRDRAVNLSMEEEPEAFDARRRATQDLTLFDVDATNQQARDLATLRDALEGLSARQLGAAVPLILATITLTRAG